MTSRAVVFAGGGVLGAGWQAAWAAGVAEHGVVLGSADLVVGVSSGAVLGARLASGELPRALLDAYEEQRGSTAASGPPRTLAGGARQFDGKPWPASLACVCADHETRDRVVWRADSGVDLGTAVAASCAAPGLMSPVTIESRRYSDGAYVRGKSGTGVDVAAGADVVVVVTFVPDSGPDERRLLAYRRMLQAEIGRVEAAGSTVVHIRPDEHLPLVASALDPSRLPEMIAHGFAQGVREGADLAAQWLGAPTAVG